MKNKDALLPIGILIFIILIFVAMFLGDRWIGKYLLAAGVGGLIIFVLWWTAAGRLLRQGDNAFLAGQWTEAQQKYQAVKRRLEVDPHDRRFANVMLRICLLALSQKAQPASLEHDLLSALHVNPHIDYPDFEKLAKKFHLTLAPRMHQVFRNAQLIYLKEWLAGPEQKVITGTAIQVVGRALEKGEAVPPDSVLTHQKVPGAYVALVPELRRNTGAVALEVVLNRRHLPDGLFCLHLDLIVRESQHFHSDGGYISDEFVTESYLSDLLFRPGLWYKLRGVIVEDVWQIIQTIVEYVKTRQLRAEVAQLNIQFSRYFPYYWIEVDRGAVTKTYHYHLGDRRIFGSYNIGIDLIRSSSDRFYTLSGQELQSFASIAQEDVQLKIV